MQVESINLDPAVSFLPYSVDHDIRTFVNYEDTMKKNKLGPNGAIMTCLNLYAAQIDNLIAHINQSVSKGKRVFIIDTPGQIEAFNWSASGQIISSALASVMPTSILYVVDLVKSQNPNTFMSNMLFCCSILFRLKLPVLIAFNKCDIEKSKEQAKWLSDYDVFLVC